MSRLSQPACWRRTRRMVLAVIGAALAAACSMNVNDLGFGPRQPEAPQQGAAIGTGQVKVGLILPLSASGNAALAAQSMKNAAEMALAEFNAPNIQLLVKDDAGSVPGAQEIGRAHV